MLKKIFRSSQFWILLTVLSSIAAITLHILDKDFQMQWFIFGLYILSVSIMPLYLFVKNFPHIITVARRATDSDLVLLFAVIICATVVRFIFLNQYPFITIGDELRDSGLDAFYIVQGVRDNLFGYGNYNGYGQIIPTISSFFYHLFGASPLMYRLPAALLSLFDCVLVFVLMRKRFGREVAAFAALVVITLPLHIFWGRSELVVGANTFIMTATLLLLDWYFHSRSPRINVRSLVVGVFFGFFSGFHFSSRIVVLLGVLLICGWVVRKHARKLPAVICALVLGFFIGFGPRIIETTPQIFFKTSTLQKGLSNNEKGDKAHPKEIVQMVAVRYAKTIGEFSMRNVDGSHYPRREPMFPAPFFVFVCFGILITLFGKKKNSTGRTILLFLIVLPLTHSAITDSPYLEHRLSSLLTPLAMMAGIGMGKCFTYLEKSRFKHAQWIFTAIVTFYAVFVCFGFFAQKSAQFNRREELYLAMHTMHVLKFNTQAHLSKNVCLHVNKEDFDEFDKKHVKEMFEFYLHPLKIEMNENTQLPRNTVSVLGSCDDTITEYISYVIHCSQESLFACPHRSENYEIRVPKNLAK